MSEWLVERGIGEDRAVRILDDAIVAAKVAWEGELLAGSVATGRLVSRHAGSSRGTARLDDGSEVLVSRLPKAASEGAPLTLEVTRTAIGEGRRRKPAQARPTDAAPKRLTLADTLMQGGESVRVVHRFPISGWNEIWAGIAEARVDFAGGALLVSPTPAMTLFDIDGTLPPAALSLAAVPALAETLALWDIGGSVGIDFPTIEAKADRRAVDDALERALQGFAHERTAMNGFGFVQIVSRSTGPSLLHRHAQDPVGCAVRLLLRRAERVVGAGAILLSCHPAVAAAIRPEWQAELARRTGRAIRIEVDPALAPHAGFAQSVAS
ncbi:MAG TPA: ribonuclease [Croceicoccus sp.]|nr:ribonuclease [Croceicoccus sp.]